MATSNLTTPGVYIQEISTLPSSIVPVATAIPGFFGYTESGPINDPVRVSSLIEFEANFGRAYKMNYTAHIDPDFAVNLVSPGDSPYTLYYHMIMYFANGGGPCHIISVGHYNYAAPAITATDFYNPSNPSLGVGMAEEVDEITLLLAPEIALLNKANDALSKSVYDAMLSQCNKLKDRFAVLDVKVEGNDTVVDDADDFRDNQVGANYLKYGAAYYPPLNTVLGFRYSDDDVTIDAASSAFNVSPNNKLATVLGGIGKYTQTEVAQTATEPDTNDTFVVTIGTSIVTLTSGIDFPTIPATDAEIAKGIVDAINNHATLAPLVRAQVHPTIPERFYVIARVGSSTTVLTVAATPNSWIAPQTGGNGIDNSQNMGAYFAIKGLLDDLKLTLYPSATMAGIYAAVDNDRGVWKAPANVGVSNISGPSIMITEEQQGYLNVNASSGKSIDAIRAFTGRGTLVWGARTLDGNSNEWRYVPVRRLFIMAEESIKKATEFVVFEPNDKNTWLRMKGMISNFLNDLWQQGALAGSKPEQAFFVNVGLGETMTPQDILEGRMIITIGMAAVRPAEFIILQFMHKLQEA